MNDQLTWYLARSAGLVAWVIAGVAVCFGLLASTGLLRDARPKVWFVDVHRMLSGLTVTFTAIHILAIFADDYVDFGVVAVLVPYGSHWRPGAVAWGIAALYLLLAVEITSRLRTRIGERVWRATHWLSPALFVTATVHGLTGGTDVTDLAVLSPAAGLVTFAAGLLWWRLRHGRPTGALSREPLRTNR